MKEGWDFKKIKEVADVFAGQGAPQGDSNYCLNGIPFVKAGNLSELINGKPESSIQNVSEQVAKTHKLKLYKAGSVLFAKSGMSCMKGYVYTLKKDCYVVSHLAIITPISIDSHFLNYYLCFNKPNTLIKDSAYPSISLKDIENLKIPVPTFSEQQQIVEELDLLNSIIEKKKEQLKELDNLAQSIFYDMFGDPVTNEKGWEVKTLENIVSESCSISYGIVQPGDDVADGIPVVRPVDLVNHIVTRNGLKRVEKSISDAYSRTILQGNEILFCVRGTTGVMSFASSDLLGCNVTRGITPLSFNSEIEKYYAYNYLNTSFMQEIISENTRGIALKQINMKDVRTLPFLLPPFSLQQKFASKIEAIEQQKELIKQSITEVETLFNSRMDFYFN